MHKRLTLSTFSALLMLQWFYTGNVWSTEISKLPLAVESGKLIANKFCSRCHAVEPNSTSPHKSAPPFLSLSKKWPLNYLEESLAEGITVGHPDMPEFKFEPDQISHLLTFLQWLSEFSDPTDPTKTDPNLDDKK